MYGWETKDKIFYAVESVLWRTAGTSAYLLQETIMISDRIRRTSVVANCVVGYKLFERPS